MAYDNRFDSLDRRVGDLARDVKEVERRLPPADFPFSAVAKLVAPKPDNWLKRNAYVMTIAGLIVGTGFVLKFFSLTVDERVDAKLNDPLHELHEAQIKMEGIS